MKTQRKKLESSEYSLWECVSWLAGSSYSYECCYFLWMGVLLAWMSVHHRLAWCSCRLEEGARSSGTGVIDGCAPLFRCWELTSALWKDRKQVSLRSVGTRARACVRGCMRAWVCARVRSGLLHRCDWEQACVGSCVACCQADENIFYCVWLPAKYA